MWKVRNVFLKEKVIGNKNHQFVLVHHFHIDNNNYFKSYNEFLYSNEKDKYSAFGFFDEDIQSITNRKNFTF